MDQYEGSYVVRTLSLFLTVSSFLRTPPSFSNDSTLSFVFAYLTLTSETPFCLSSSPFLFLFFFAFIFWPLLFLFPFPLRYFSRSFSLSFFLSLFLSLSLSLSLSLTLLLSGIESLECTRTKVATLWRIIYVSLLSSITYDSVDEARAEEHFP